MLKAGVTAQHMADGSVDSLALADDSIVDADIKSDAAIAYSKLALTGAILNADIDGMDAAKLTDTIDDARYGVNVTTQGNVFNAASQLVRMGADNKLPAVDGSNLSNITGSQVDSIDADKINEGMLKAGVTAQHMADGSVDSLALADDSIVDADIKSDAAIAYSKLALTGAILNADIDGMDAAKLTDTIDDARYGVNVTTQGNVFNAASQLVRMGADNKLPAVDGSNLSNITGSQVDSIDADKINEGMLKAGVTAQHMADGSVDSLALADDSIVDADIKSDAAIAYSKLALTGAILNADIDGMDAAKLTDTIDDARYGVNVTTQGNVFNAASQLVRMGADNKLPAVDGSNLSNITGSQVDSIDADKINEAC